jgi:RNA polymerase sigma-70 factor (ECF subfamily)
MITKEEIQILYNKLYPDLKSFVYRLTCDREVAHDIVQDTFVKAIEKQEQFKGASSPKTWLFSIATHLSMDWLRHKKRWTESAQDEAKKLSMTNGSFRERYIHIHQHSPAGKFEVLEHINFCFTCIAKTLPIEQQVALILKDIYDFKVEEIGDLLNTPRGTIKHWLHLGRTTMTRIFERRCALINKQGACYQCSELNGLFNPHKPLRNPLLMNTRKESYFRLRTELIRNIDPLNGEGSDLEDNFMQVLRLAIND